MASMSVCTRVHIVKRFLRSGKDVFRPALLAEEASARERSGSGVVDPKQDGPDDSCEERPVESARLDRGGAVRRARGLAEAR